MSNNTITVIDREGSPSQVKWEPEQTLMEALRDKDFPLLASCGGTASCATCHVYLESQVVAELGERSEDEISRKPKDSMPRRHDCPARSRTPSRSTESP